MTSYGEVGSFIVLEFPDRVVDHLIKLRSSRMGLSRVAVKVVLELYDSSWLKQL